MEFMSNNCSLLLIHLKPHLKKFLAIVTCSATLYCINKILEIKREKRKNSAKLEKKAIKEFPSVDQIQQFIEELPFHAARSDPNVNLRSLLNELSEFSEDEDWKGLIASVHSIYEQDKKGSGQCEDGLKNAKPADDNVIDIRDDDRVLTFRSIPETSPNMSNDKDVLTDNSDVEFGSASSKNNGDISHKKGEGDTATKNNLPKEKKSKEKIVNFNNFALGDATKNMI